MKFFELLLATSKSLLMTDVGNKIRLPEIHHEILRLRKFSQRIYIL